jgi:hypothetical protein
MGISNKYFILIAFVLLFSGEVAMPQGLGSEKFNQGTELFKAGNYNEALKAWTELYNSGFISANLNYNIGNAYFKMNNIPKAILFYEKAYLLNPADEEINYNMQIARSLIVDRFQEIPELFFVRWYNFVALLWSSNAWAAISIISFIICLVSLSVYIYSSRFALKVAGFWLAVLLIVISSLSIIFSIRNSKLIHDSHQAIVVTPVINGKSSPDNSGNDLFVIHEGTKVSIEDKVGEWLEIRLSDGNKGWVPSNSIDII